MLSIHPYAQIFPAMTPADFAQLKEDIAEQGLREPIWLYQGQVLDGRHRYQACNELGLEAPTRDYTGDDPVGFIVSLNLHRRQLTPAQRAMIASEIANLRDGCRADYEVAAVQTCTAAPPIRLTDAGKLLGVSRRAVAQAKKIKETASPELSTAVLDGKISLNSAEQIADVEPEVQAEIVAKGEKEILRAAKQIRQDKAKARQAELVAVRAIAPPPVQGKYQCIVIDPPWEMAKIERDVAPNQVAFDYPTMTEEELAKFDVPGMTADDCHLFCWTTHKHLPMALRLVEAWGFTYVLTMVWHKNGGFQPFGLPQYNCEFVVYAKHGKPYFADTKAFPTCFEAPRREHSRKPDEFYDLIRRVAPGPRIDVFSRENRDGFAVYGNEAGKFSDAA